MQYSDPTYFQNGIRRLRHFYESGKRAEFTIIYSHIKEGVEALSNADPHSLWTEQLELIVGWNQELNRAG